MAVAKDTESIDPHASLLYLHNNIDKYAQAKAKRIYLEEYRKVCKASQMRVAEVGEGIKAIAAQEREAYASQAYRTNLEAIRDAVAEEEALRWRLDTARLEIEVWRSTNANTRAAT